MTTSFSFAGTPAWARSTKGPLGAVEKLGLLQKAQARWNDSRDTREQERNRRRVEETRISGRKPVNQFVGSPASAETQGSIKLADENDIIEPEMRQEENTPDSR